MIYGTASPGDALDQGDLIDACPILAVAQFAVNDPDALQVKIAFQRVLVVIQTCDLANDKMTIATVATVYDTRQLVRDGTLKSADVKGPLRAGRIWGLYFLPADAVLGLEEMIIDLRRLHTVPLDLLRELCRVGKRRARLPTPYREHLAKHLADTFSRIGLPRPYETL